MAWGRKKSGGRKEPVFGLGASLAELRLTLKDRIAPAADDKPKKQAAKRKIVEDDDEHEDEAPVERKPRASRSARKRRSGRTRLRRFRLVYWGVVLGLWGAIAAIGVIVWVGAHLPAIQSLEIPKRPPTIQITGV